jgi:hypothetical protein
MDQASMPRDDAPHTGPELTTTEARQGETSGHVRRVLAGSLTLAAIVFVLLYVFYIA